MAWTAGSQLVPAGVLPLYSLQVDLKRVGSQVRASSLSVFLRISLPALHRLTTDPPIWVDEVLERCRKPPLGRDAMASGQFREVVTT